MRGGGVRIHEAREKQSECSRHASWLPQREETHSACCCRVDDNRTRSSACPWAPSACLLDGCWLRCRSRLQAQASVAIQEEHQNTFQEIISWADFFQAELAPSLPPLNAKLNRRPWPNLRLIHPLLL